MLYTLLNIRQQEMQQALDQPYLRLLGASKTGRAFIKQQRKHVSIPVVNHVTHEDTTGILTLDYRAGKLYELMIKQPVRQAMDTGRIPLFTE